MSKRAHKLAKRLNKETILAHMPKVYYIFDESRGEYRVGQTDWPSDVFNFVSKEDFETFKKVYIDLLMPLIDRTFDDDNGS
jgi:hypothetical protein